VAVVAEVEVADNTAVVALAVLPILLKNTLMPPASTISAGL